MSSLVAIDVLFSCILLLGTLNSNTLTDNFFTISEWIFVMGVERTLVMIRWTPRSLLFRIIWRYLINSHLHFFFLYLSCLQTRGWTNTGILLLCFLIFFFVSCDLLVCYGDGGGIDRKGCVSYGKHTTRHWTDSANIDRQPTWAYNKIHTVTQHALECFSCRTCDTSSSSSSSARVHTQLDGSLARRGVAHTIHTSQTHRQTRARLVTSSSTSCNSIRVCPVLFICQRARLLRALDKSMRRLLFCVYCPCFFFLLVFFFFILHIRVLSSGCLRLWDVTGSRAVRECWACSRDVGLAMWWNLWRIFAKSNNDNL